MRRKHLPLARLRLPSDRKGRQSRVKAMPEMEPTRVIDSLHQRLAQLQALYQLTAALSRTTAVEDVYDAALAGLLQALAVDRASILLFDPDGIMRFKAWRGLSESYRRATEGHTPWSPDTVNPQPVLVSDVDAEPSLVTLHAVIQSEGIQALAFVPLLHQGRLLGKFMLYYPTPHLFTDDEVQLTQNIADHIAVAVARRHAEEALHSSQERLALACQAANIGTFEWNIQTNAIIWSAEEEVLYGLPPGSFGGTYEHWKQTVHPADRDTAERAVVQAARTGRNLDTEFRIIWPDGSVHWIAAKGRVYCDQEGTSLRMIGVNEDITLRKQAEVERAQLLESERAARADAQEAVRLRDVFLSVAAHELKTPLASLLGQTQLLQRRAQRDSTVGEREMHSITVIAAQSSRLHKMILALLDMSRLESGQFSIERAPLDLRSLVQRVVAEVQPTLQQHTVTSNSSGDSLIIEGDELRLEEVLHNLVQNAIKYSPKGGQVTIEVMQRGTTACVAVSDAGIGIPSEALPRLFSRFYRAPNAEAQHIVGMGIGLYVVKEIIRLHGGTVTVESIEGKGSAFTICLPVLEHSAAAQVTSGQDAG